MGITALEAAKRSGLKEASFNRARGHQQRTDAPANGLENRQVYGNDIRSVIESVRATVLALASRGHMQHLRLMFRSPDSAKKHYVTRHPLYREANPESGVASRTRLLLIAQKLERTRKGGTEANDEVVAAINSLQLIERGQMQEKDLRRGDGSYKSVEAILEMTRELKKRYPIFLANVEETKKATADQKKQIEASLRHAHAEQVKKDKELEKAEQEYTQAKKAEIAVDVKRQAEKLKTIEAERKQNAERIRDYEDKKRKVDQNVEAQHKAEQLAKEKREKQETENWNSLFKTLVDRLNRVMSVEDSLYNQLLHWRENARVTTSQRSSIALALRNASNRFAEFNPHKTTPSAKEEEAMKNLERKAQKREKK